MALAVRSLAARGQVVVVHGGGRAFLGDADACQRDIAFLLAGVLEVDRNELGGNLELHQREPGPSPGFTDR